MRKNLVLEQVKALFSGRSKESIEDFFCDHGQAILMRLEQLDIEELQAHDVLYDFKMISRLICCLADIDLVEGADRKRELEIVEEFRNSYGTWRYPERRLQLYYSALMKITDSEEGYGHSEFSLIAFSFLLFTFQ
ncbi:hypothetical protein [Chitinophaga japonensis]|uniref:Uncharacterized protein n=1 Tax=Chitinophaga japonensis TaxID=104662 RepID=A0A562T292_CHIJA|nr:hypothetical protein [Chitinophaga japonensis]TWI87791.1 hypothetical protein LX66_1862 [Chitinophaga japonensis]